jgi:choloylglycine hydrolase
MRNNRLFSCVLTLAALLPLAIHTFAAACTAFQIRAKDGSIIYFRSMEFGFPFNSKVLVIPRGTEFVGTTPDGKPGLRWTSTYGIVGLNADVAPNLVADGQNEKGLAFGMLYLPGYAKFLAPDPASNDRAIGSWEAGGYLLSTCATVDEALTALREKVRIVEQQFPAFKMPLPVHYWIGDASGKVVIVEFVDGKMNVYDNPIGILTNSPPFDWHTTNLSNYVNLSPVNVPGENFGETFIANYGQGSGLLGLPGDFTPPSRFVRAAFFSQVATPAPTAIDTVNLGFHVLNTFDIFDGAIRSNTSNQTPNTKGFLATTSAPKIVNTDTTEWVVAHDRTNLKTYVRTYNGLEVQVVDLKKIDFTKPGLRTIALKNEFKPVDITDTAVPFATK